jgi:hypothetical protein
LFVNSFNGVLDFARKLFLLTKIFASSTLQNASNSNSFFVHRWHQHQLAGILGVEMACVP